MIQRCFSAENATLRGPSSCSSSNKTSYVNEGGSV